MTGFARWMLLCATAVFLAATGCASTPPPAPPARLEMRPAKPHPRAVWVAGHWQYKSRRHGYVWIPGHWRTP